MDMDNCDSPEPEKKTRTQNSDCTSNEDFGRQQKRRRHWKKTSAGPYSSLTRTLSFASSTIGADEQETDSSLNFTAMSKEKKFTVIACCMSNFWVGAFYSLLAPFFPTEAAKKLVNPTIIGLIFGVFELILVLTSPIFGTYMTAIGAKFMYVAGIFVCGCSSILFGFLDGCPDGTIYIVMCFLVRGVEALGAAAFSTASFAIIAQSFPDSVSTMFGYLELFSGLGLMVGPPIGGALFQFGGFKLPFICLGLLLIAVGLTSIQMLPSQQSVQLPNEGSVLALLKIPIIPIMGLCLMCGSASLGFLDVALSLFLSDEYGLTPVILGLVFLVGPGVYAIMAPVWGYIVDKTPRYNNIYICIGYALGGLAFFLMGPAPFFHLGDHLWLVIVSLAIMGLGISTLVVSFQVIAEATMAEGYAENLSTYGVIAGIFNSFFSCGAFIGPLGGGYLLEVIGFSMAAVVIGSCGIGASLVLLLYIIITYTTSKHRKDKIFVNEENEPLLQHENEAEVTHSSNDNRNYQDLATGNGKNYQSTEWNNTTL